MPQQQTHRWDAPFVIPMNVYLCALLFHARNYAKALIFCIDTSLEGMHLDTTKNLMDCSISISSSKAGLTK